MFKQKLTQSEKAFTLVEVLVAILVVTFFVTVTMEALTIAAVLKFKGQQLTLATKWIQQDIESVKNAADRYQFPTLTNAASSGSTSISVSSLYGLASGDTILIGTDPYLYTIQSISGSTLTLNTGLSSAQAASAMVVDKTTCTSQIQGTANYFNNYTASNSSTQVGNSPTITINGVTYYPVTSGQNPIPLGSGGSNNKFWLVRNSNPVTSGGNTAQNVLQLNYAVVRDYQGGLNATYTPIATFYTEAIPYAALQCP